MVPLQKWTGRKRPVRWRILWSINFDNCLHSYVLGETGGFFSKAYRLNTGSSELFILRSHQQRAKVINLLNFLGNRPRTDGKTVFMSQGKQVDPTRVLPAQKRPVEKTLPRWKTERFVLKSDTVISLGHTAPISLSCESVFITWQP